MINDKLLNNITTMIMENSGRITRAELFSDYNTNRSIASDESSSSSRNNNNILNPSKYVILMSCKCTKIVRRFLIINDQP
mmetsp:Transcript_10553/g.11304  ORF Transcript_10553/g.11304 Transcript_10553/m.11304 type:complete len:80 (-) Transcript_10553:192-431(-)